MPGKGKPSASWRNTARLVIGLVLIGIMGLGSAGCRLGAPRDFRNENDRLRRENLELRREVEQLSEQLELRRGELANLRRQLDRAEAESMPEAETPTLSRLRMGRYSGGVDTDGDGRDNLIRVYLQPLDQRGRVLPVAGRATMQAVAMIDDDQPQVLAQRTYEPDEFDRAWRSAFTGRHYTLELNLPPDTPPHVSEVNVRVTFTQARTGVEMSTQESFRIRQP